MKSFNNLNIVCGFKKVFLILFFPFILFGGCDIVSEFVDLPDIQTGSSSELTEREIVQGLKEALMVGTDKSVQAVSRHNGFYRNPEIFIPFPEEAIRVREVCERAGLTNQINEFEEKLNRAAELASKEAKDIFVNAIRQMTIRDAMNILQGSENEATEYLKRTSSNQLYQRFYPIVKNATNEVRLAQYWSVLVERYNRATAVTGGEAVDTDLNNYVTERTINGIFVMIAKEEANIRKNPAARINDILRKVFGSSHNKFN